MGSTINPIYANLYAAIPGMNPTGNQIAVPGAAGGNSGSNSLLPKPNMSTSSIGTGNPYDVVPGGTGSSTPGFTANTGPYTSTGGSLLPGGTPGDASSAITGGVDPAYWDQMYKQLSKTYGSGTANILRDFLRGGAGYNQQAINNLLASLQPGINRGEEDLMSQFSVLGNRFGSGAQIGLGDYLSQVNLNEGQLISQMYEKAVDNYINVLMGTSETQAKAKMNSPNPLDAILGGLGIGTSAAGLLGGTGSSFGLLALLGI